MDIKEEEEIKKEFQLERVILFTDAVFAIIITIMVLEIKLPEDLRHAEHDEIRKAFIGLIPKVGGYIISFFIVGIFWVKHLKMFSYLKDYTTQLITLNLLFLFFISLFPFSISLLSETISPQNYDALFVYFTVILLAFLSQTLITGYLVKNAQKLCIKPQELERNLEWKLQRIHFVSIPLLFTYIFLGGYIYNFPPQLFSYGFIIWALSIAIIRKRLYPKPHYDGPILARLFKSLRNRSLKAKQNSEN
ncbi:TMEM175 family protein [Mucilaginibacter segetis]|uniref:DUF1211 domain-containing protein n=1 Tax=Mucilaginibacter segetis TaxID=2793071 RepID=A0A934UMM5_9SPHI|nr:TMEM175 family protein [Mucilaginibacter segetis]MBK0379180.1 DUF1211 domain-containing protein [Mucilaginibacter segetis]